MNLETAGVDFDNTTGIRVNDFLQTSNPLIYPAGDSCLELKYTHSAEASARIVVQNALFGGRQRLSALIIPWCTYTDPAIAHVGLYVRQAREQDVPVKTFTIPMHDVYRAISDGEEAGFVMIHVREGTDRILGATIVARHAGEMINEITLAMVKLETKDGKLEGSVVAAGQIGGMLQTSGLLRWRPALSRPPGVQIHSSEY